jgi:hypothetical protein
VEALRAWIDAGALWATVDSEVPQFSADSPPTYDAPIAIQALAFSADGQWLAVAGRQEILLLDAASALRGETHVVRRLVGLAPRIEDLAFAPAGPRLAAVGGSPGRWGEVQIWDAGSGELLASRRLTSDVLRGVSWSPDGKRVALGGSDTELYVLAADGGATIVQQGAHTDWVLASVFSHDGAFVASGSRDRTLRLIDTSTGRFVDQITSVSPNIPSDQWYALARHPHRDQVLAGGRDGVLRTYLMHRLVDRKIGDDNQLVRRYPPVGGPITSVAFSPDGRTAAAASVHDHRGTLQLVQIPDAWEPPDAIRAIQAKVVDQRSASEAAELEAYHAQDAEELARVELPAAPQAVAFAPGGEAALVAGSDGWIGVYGVPDGAQRGRFMPFPLETEPQSSVAAESVRREFLTDVMPQLAKLGCNAGTCHGAQAGQQGFKLSLRGYDPEGDYRALVEELKGRRVDRAEPAESLILLKATGRIPHGGGVLTRTDERGYAILHDWIAQGAAFRGDAPRATSLSIAPAEPLADLPGEQVALEVTAHYADGSTRDVTQDAFYESGDLEVASIDGAGRVDALRRGEAPLLVRYEGNYASTTLTVMGDRSGYAPRDLPQYNRIDELVDAKLRRMKIAPSDLCTDEEFLRRATIDLTGLLPTPTEIREFLADPRPSREKRAATVDRLLASDAYVEHQTNRWADLLLVNGKLLGREGAVNFRDWIRTAVAENRPYDVMVRQILTATGSNREHPEASYFKALRDPTQICETSTQLFFGVRFNCNKCHDHPFERWTQDDYYGLAAWFAQVRLTPDPSAGDRTIAGSAVDAARPLFEVVDDQGETPVVHLRRGQPAEPRLPFQAELAEGADGSLRAAAAVWWTSPENRYFATSFVNRVWARLLGVGLIEPVDDLRASNPPTNPELLEWLTRDFVEHDFDVQHLFRTICNSRTYQLSAETNRWNADDERNYSHAMPRRLPAETLVDAVHQAVGASLRIPGAPEGVRAVALPDALDDFPSGLLAQLGRPARESGCECERSQDLQLGPVMALVNGPVVAEALASPDNALARLEAELDDRALVDELFLRFLGRAPNAAEAAAAYAMLQDPANDRDAALAAADQRRTELEAQLDDWRHAHRPTLWHALQPDELTSDAGAVLAVQDDGSVVAEGPLVAGVYRVAAAAPVERVAGLRLEALADERLPQSGPGRAENGNFVLSEVRVHVAPAGSRDAWQRAKLRAAEADYAQGGYDAPRAIDGDEGTGWAIAGGTGQRHEIIFTFARPLGFDEGTQILIELDQRHADGKHLLGRFRLSATAETPKLADPSLPPEIAGLLALDDAALDDAGRGQLREFLVQQDPQYRQWQRAAELLANPRLTAVQDLAWALVNSPAFLFVY